MEELIFVLAWNLEAYGPTALFRNNWLLAFAAIDDGSEFHESLPERCLLFPVGQFISRSLQILLGFSLAARVPGQWP